MMTAIVVGTVSGRVHVCMGQGVLERLVVSCLHICWNKHWRGSVKCVYVHWAGEDESRRKKWCVNWSKNTKRSTVYSCK